MKRAFLLSLCMLFAVSLTLPAFAADDAKTCPAKASCTQAKECKAEKADKDKCPAACCDKEKKCCATDAKCPKGKDPATCTEKDKAKCDKAKSCCKASQEVKKEEKKEEKKQ